MKPITQPLIGDPSSAYIIHGPTKSREGMEKPGNGWHIKGAIKMQHVHCPPAIGTLLVSPLSPILPKYIHEILGKGTF